MRPRLVHTLFYRAAHVVRAPEPSFFPRGSRACASLSLPAGAFTSILCKRPGWNCRGSYSFLRYRALYPRRRFFFLPARTRKYFFCLRGRALRERFSSRKLLSVLRLYARFFGAGWELLYVYRGNYFLRAAWKTGYDGVRIKTKHRFRVLSFYFIFAA